MHWTVALNLELFHGIRAIKGPGDLSKVAFEMRTRQKSKGLLGFLSLG